MSCEPSFFTPENMRAEFERQLGFALLIGRPAGTCCFDEATKAAIDEVAAAWPRATEHQIIKARVTSDRSIFLLEALDTITRN